MASGNKLELGHTGSKDENTWEDVMEEPKGALLGQGVYNYEYAEDLWTRILVQICLPQGRSQDRGFKLISCHLRPSTATDMSGHQSTT